MNKNIITNKVQKIIALLRLVDDKGDFYYQENPEKEGYYVTEKAVELAEEILIDLKVDT